MITIKHPADFPETYPLDRIGPRKDLLFFDIETTGFSGDTSQLYLIGCVYHDGFGWKLIQWFADTRQAEAKLLDAFFSFMKRFKILVHFNGDRFDIPYLEKCCRRLGLNHSFEGMKSLDIYRMVRPFRQLLGLESMKQKAIEQFLGVSLVSEKEVIFIVTKSEQKNAIMSAIMEKAGLTSKAGTIVFSLPVTSTAGLRILEDEEENS